MRYVFIAALGLSLASSVTWADDYIPPVVGGRTYIQHQIEVAKERHPEILAIVVTGIRDGAKNKDVVILGSTLGASTVFQKSPDATAADGAAPSKDGRQLIVRTPFLSSTDHRLGTIELRFAQSGGTATAASQAVASAVQSELKRATLSAKNAVDPWPYDAAYGPGTHAQALTEKILAAHPDLLVIMLHATPPGKKTNVIVGSNIGRFGKAADEDDLRVIEKGSTNLELADSKDRFETELPLNDASGKRIGALGLVFPFHPGQDREALHAHGRAIRDELARMIPNNATLFAPR